MNLEKYSYNKLKSTYIRLNLSSYLFNDIIGTEFLFQELQIFYFYNFFSFGRLSVICFEVLFVTNYFK